MADDKGAPMVPDAEGAAADDALLRHHSLKTWPEYFAEVVAGRKTFEVRRNDRDFAVGDALVLREWNPATESYTGCWCTRRVTYITEHAQKNGYVVMAVMPFTEPTHTTAQLDAARAEARAAAFREAEGMADEMAKKHWREGDYTAGWHHGLEALGSWCREKAEAT